jgi:release factor glutamine methyltransferase
MTADVKVSARVALEQARARLLITAVRKHAHRDAELLLRHVTVLTRAGLLSHPERPLTAAELEAFFLAVERRAQSEPIQYITGVQEFYGLDFKVTPAVLIPRPETEHLVETAFDLAKKMAGSLRILDVGTGSGAIAVTLAHLLPKAEITATDISPAALKVANENAVKHGAEGRITFVECDLMPAGKSWFDLICSNPPYVPSGEILEAQVAAFEPHSALFAGPDGLGIYRRLIPLAAAALHPGGWLLLEIGHGQQAAVESLLRASHLLDIYFVSDLQGIPRVAVAHL